MDMPETAPQWAIERALEFFNAEEKLDPRPSILQWRGAFARYIAEHEDPPVDPLILEARKFAEDRDWFQNNRIADLRSGRCDDSHMMIDLLAALRRGMEIAKDGGSPA